MKPGRLHFAWISSAEGEKFARFAAEVVETVRALGPTKRFINDSIEIEEAEVQNV